MITVEVIKELNQYVFSIADGLEEIHTIQPDFINARITAEFEIFQDFEIQNGLGSMRKAIEQFYGLDGKLEVKFVDSEGVHIRPLR